MTRTRCSTVVPALVAAATVWGCADAPTRPLTTPAAHLDAVELQQTTASTMWNERALSLVARRPPGNAQAAVSRMLTYLSIAQYRAVLAAEAAADASTHPSVLAAVGGASATVLGGFFPLDVAAIDAYLNADLAAPELSAANHPDAASGEAIGRAIGAVVVASAARDNYLVDPIGNPPVGEGFWVSSGAPTVRSLYGVHPFFLTSADQLRPPPPPAFGSHEFLAALAEVRAFSDSRTPEQLHIAQYWNTASAPFTAGALNLLADDLIREHNLTEREAARVLAYANAAAFDAQIACWDAKVAYWSIRPSQADPHITLAIALPNHPSFPSGHACITGAIITVLIDAFPGERDRLEGKMEEAGLSRIYGGIHYRFDIEAGQTIGAGAAALALAGSLE